MILNVKGKVSKGRSEGSKFTMLPWVVERVKEKLGFKPYPGTLNLLLAPDNQLSVLLKKFRGWKIPAQKGCFSGRFYRALVMNRVAGAVVRPDVPGYPENVVEIVAPVCLRDLFGLKDGDAVTVKIWLEK